MAPFVLSLKFVAAEADWRQDDPDFVESAMQTCKDAYLAGTWRIANVTLGQAYVPRKTLVPKDLRGSPGFLVDALEVAVGVKGGLPVLTALLGAWLQPALVANCGCGSVKSKPKPEAPGRFSGCWTGPGRCMATLNNHERACHSVCDGNAGAPVTPEDLYNVARLRNLQSEATAGLNALVWRISDASEIRPSAEQWAVLWPALEAAAKIVQDLAEQLGAAQASAKAQQRRLRNATAGDTDSTEAR